MLAQIKPPPDGHTGSAITEDLPGYAFFVAHVIPSGLADCAIVGDFPHDPMLLTGIVSTHPVVDCIVAVPHFILVMVPVKHLAEAAIAVSSIRIHRVMEVRFSPKLLEHFNTHRLHREP